jgi:hypothetical protein
LIDVSPSNERDVAARPYCWIREEGQERLTLRQAKAIAESEHCTESAYIHPVGEPTTRLTSRSDVEAHVQARTNGRRQNEH